MYTTPNTYTFVTLLKENVAFSGQTIVDEGQSDVSRPSRSLLACGRVLRDEKPAKEKIEHSIKILQITILCF